MGFWTTALSIPFLSSLFPSSDPFTPRLLPPLSLPLPSSVFFEVLTYNSSPESLKEVRQFLFRHFGRPPATPQLCLPSAYLHATDRLFVLRERATGTVIGCVRYRRGGIFQEQTLYVVDAFCIHPDWRKRGLADLLLSTLHREANRQGIPFALFLKEGAPLWIPMLPFHQGVYTYRVLAPLSPGQSIRRISTSMAYRLISLYQRIRPHTFVLLHKEAPQQWIVTRSRFVCVQPTDQRWEGRPMGWITACFQWGPSSWEEMDAIADSFYGEYGAIWSTKEWCPHWKEDGPFYWYSYQWSSSCTPKGSYAIVT